MLQAKDVGNGRWVLVLDRGHLVEQGSHQELMAQRGLYFFLANRQLRL